MKRNNNSWFKICQIIVENLQRHMQYCIFTENVPSRNIFLYKQILEYCLSLYTQDSKHIYKTISYHTRFVSPLLLCSSFIRLGPSLHLSSFPLPLSTPSYCFPISLSFVEPSAPSHYLSFKISFNRERHNVAIFC